MALRSAALFLFGAAAIAAQVSGVSVDGVTAQQAVITFQVPDAAQCTLRVFRDSGRTQLADDTNEALFAGSTACNRTGSAVNGKRVSFVAGLRTSQLARDGLMHSRSLATLTTYYYTITDEVTQASQQGQFTTANLPSGNLYPEQVPWDANGFGNAAYPNLDFGGTGQGCGGANGNAGACIDPVTGLQYWLFTSAGAHGSLSTPWNGAQTLFQTPVLSGGSCDTAANMVNNPGNHFATCNGPMSALLTAQNWIPPNTYNPVYQFGVSYGKGQFNPLATVDDMIVAVDGYASDANNQDNEVDVCLWSGAANACLGNTFTITLPVGSAGSAQQFNVPHDVPKPYWQDWGYAPDQGNVSQPTFRVWRRGAGGSVSLSVWFTGATSMAWWNYESVPVRCEDNPRDIAWDRNGNALNAHLQGYFCYATDQQNPIPELWLWIPFNPDGTLRAETRWMGTVYNTTNFVNYNGAVMGFQGAYVYAAYPATGPTDVARFTYNTEKFPYCHYNDLRTVTDPENGGWYASNTQGYAPDSCFDRQIVTNGALHMMLSAWAAKHPDLSDPTNFTNAGSAGIIFAHGLITFSVASNPSWGDTLHVIGMFDPDGNLLGVSDDFTNHECAGGSGPTCSGGTWVPKMGWALNHGGTAGMPGGQYAMIGILNTPPSDGSMALAGPWSVPVLAVNRRGFGAAAVWDCSGCQGGPTQTSTIGDADMYQCPNTPITERLCPNGAGAGKCCVEVKVNQEPCSVTPYAKTKTFINNAATEAEGFPCTSTDNKTMVNAAWSKLQNSQVGDWLMENNANNGAVGADAESFVLAQKSLDGAGNVNAMWLVRESNAGVDAKLWAPLPPHSLSATRHPCLDPPNCSAS
ncbi:MAG TPA: hypothetical protein VFA04_10305, partial [Bryobacteraceae bacterium]|nr:hypothetical protein [Bryobacteraceae bacterium]